MNKKTKKFCFFACVSIIFLLASSLPCFALNLDKVKANFLNANYKSAIQEGEKILASVTHSPELDELYYLMGLCYLKEGNYLRASDIFEIILSEFKGGRFQEEAVLSLGDTYFLRGDLSGAEAYYKSLIDTVPQTKFKPALYYRLSEIGFKKGEAQNGKEYLEKLKQEFPLYAESKLNSDSAPLNGFSSGIYYSVQVGSFASRKNADSLTEKLTGKGYPAYIEEMGQKQPTSYRVRVGKLKTRQEAVDLGNKLSQEGYPVKIYP